MQKTENPAKPRSFEKSEKEIKEGILTILREDAEFCREMQECARYQEERIAWQNRLMHTLDLANKIRVFFLRREESAGEKTDSEKA